MYPGTSAPLQFGTISVGTTEVLPLTVTALDCLGTATVGTSGSGPSYNVLTTAQNTCQGGIAAGQSCTLPVGFDPASIGAHDDVLTLEASGSSSHSPTVGLDGIGDGIAASVNTTTTLTSSPNPSLLGQPVTFTATVKPTSGPVPTGTVNFEHLGALLDTETLSNGVASFTTSTLPANVANHIVAVYSGSARKAGSTSAELVQAVTGDTTTTTLASSANPSVLGQRVTLYRHRDSRGPCSHRHRRLRAPRSDSRHRNPQQRRRLVHYRGPAAERCRSYRRRVLRRQYGCPKHFGRIGANR